MDEALTLNLRGMGYDDGLRPLLTVLRDPRHVPTQQLKDDLQQMHGYVEAALERGPESSDARALGKLLADLSEAHASLAALETAQNALARFPRLETLVESLSYLHNGAEVQRALNAYGDTP